MAGITPIEFKDDRLVLIDQRKLPHSLEYTPVETLQQVFMAIKDMVVRGAPAIGITAAYGMYFAARNAKGIEDLQAAGRYLKESRPTAVNLAWAIDRVLAKVAQEGWKGSETAALILEEAHSIKREDGQVNRRIGENLLEVLGSRRNILTHCNAGILATGEYGTATAPFYLGKERGIEFKVYADETRPRLQGSTLTAYELMSCGIDVTVITDNTAAHLMSMGRIEAVITGCDRVAANGDAANKIGTLGVSIIARYYGIPMYIAAPLSSIDMGIASGKDIPIEERGEWEVVNTFSTRTAPENVKVLNYAFDVTPAENITALVTEKGVVHPPFTDNLKKVFSDQPF